MKKVIRTNTEIPVTTLDNVSEDKIYAFADKDGDIYKLHRLWEDEQCAWGDMENVSFFWNGKQDTMRKAIESVLSKNVYEFDNLKEFAEWLVKETK